jgi:hypothetical protein
MDTNIGRMVNATGVAVPLAAQLLMAIAESGASQLEITTALAMVDSLRSLLPGKTLPEYVEAPQELASVARIVHPS